MVGDQAETVVNQRDEYRSFLKGLLAPRNTSRREPEMSLGKLLRLAIEDPRKKLIQATALNYLSATVSQKREQKAMSAIARKRMQGLSEATAKGLGETARSWAKLGRDGKTWEVSWDHLNNAEWTGTPEELTAKCKTLIEGDGWNIESIRARRTPSFIIIDLVATHPEAIAEPAATPATTSTRRDVTIDDVLEFLKTTSHENQRKAFNLLSMMVDDEPVEDEDEEDDEDAED